MENNFLSKFGTTGDSLNNVINKAETQLGNVLDNSYVYVALCVFLGLYAAFAAPNLPKNVALLLDTTVVRVIFAAVIVLTAFTNPIAAILLAVAFIVTLQTANKYKLYDNSESVLAPGSISWLPSARQGARGSEGDASRASDARSATSSGRGKFGESVLGGVSSVANNVTGSVREVGSGVVNGVSELSSSVFNSARSVGGGVVGGVQQVGKGLAVGVEHVGSGVYKGVSNFGGCVVKSASQIGSGLVEGVQNVTGGLVGGVQQFGSGVVGGVQELTGGVVNTTRHLGKGVMGGFKQLGLAEHYTNSVPTPADKCDFAPFTTQDQFNHIESNLVPGVNQGSCVQSFSNQFCIQGLQSSGVGGYTTEGYLNVEPEVSQNAGQEHFYGGDDDETNEYFSNANSCLGKVQAQCVDSCEWKNGQCDMKAAAAAPAAAAPADAAPKCESYSTDEMKCKGEQSCSWEPPKCSTKPTPKKEPFYNKY
jgi:hypothetical protein